jgi:hypothetical protein
MPPPSYHLTLTWTKLMSSTSDQTSTVSVLISDISLVQFKVRGWKGWGLAFSNMVKTQNDFQFEIGATIFQKWVFEKFHVKS